LSTLSTPNAPSSTITSPRYNDFLSHRLQHVIDNIRIGDDETSERGVVQTDIEGYFIKLGKISIGRPVVKEADGSLRPLTPMESRLRTSPTRRRSPSSSSRSSTASSTSPSSSPSAACP